MEVQSTRTGEAGHGAEGAVRELFVQHHAALFRTALGILRSREDAEDAVQSAYYNALRAMDGFRHEAQLKTWMIRIVVNCCLVQIRKRRASREVELAMALRSFPSFESDAVTPEKLSIEREMRMAHLRAASQLPRRLHEVYVPCALQGASIAEAAEQLGLSNAASKSRLHRARRIVEESLCSTMQRRVA